MSTNTRKTIVSFAILLIVFLMTSCDKGMIQSDMYGTISGTLIEMGSGEPIQGALITLSPGGKNTYTGYDGSFDFLELEAKQYTLTAQKAGYEANRKTVTTLSGSTVTVSLVMQKSR